MGTGQEDESPAVGREAPTDTNEVPGEKGVSGEGGDGEPSTLQPCWCPELKPQGPFPVQKDPEHAGQETQRNPQLLQHPIPGASPRAQAPSDHTLAPADPLPSEDLIFPYLCGVGRGVVLGSQPSLSPPVFLM